jgi:hypothetical protein
MTQKALTDLIPSIKLFLTHWQSVENFLGSPMTLTDGSNRDRLANTLTSIEASDTTLLTLTNNQQTLQNTRERLRAPLHAMAKQARISLNGLAGNTDAIGSLPKLLTATSDPAKYLPVVRDIADTWARVNALPQAAVPAATLPLTIPIGDNETIVQKTRTEFVTAIDALATAVDDLAGNAMQAREQRARRDELHQMAREILKRYSPTVKAKLPAGHALVKNLPKL